MDGVRLHIRLILLCLLVLSLSFVLGGRLVNMQIVHGAVWLENSEITTRRVLTQTASRGDITDRYGRALVSNRPVYEITIDYSGMTASDNPGAELLALARAALATGHDYHDDFPVTDPPFHYTEMSAEQKKRLDNYLLKNNWAPDTGAAQLVAFIGTKFKLPGNLSEEEARIAAGLLYEVDMRYLASAYPPPYLYVPPYVFAEDVSMELVSMLYEQSYAGARVYVAEERVYNTDAAAHILGRVGPIFAEDYEAYLALGYSGDETVGTDGAEKAFESFLRGTAGEVTQTLNEQGRVVASEQTVAPVAGKNVSLTIDIRLQEQTELLLAEGIRELQQNGETLKGLEAEAGSAVVLDVTNGEVLAMANYPTYAPDSFAEDYALLSQDPLKPLLNRAISGTYAPGSTFKMVTAAAGFDAGIISPGSTIKTLGIYTRYTDYQPRCTAYPGTHGTINVSQALKVSCNYFFFDVGYNVGIAALREWAGRFGLGSLTGIELEGEKAGYIAGPDTSTLLGDTWYQGNTLSAAIGQQNNMFTPLQLANYVAVIANGGSLYRPHILKEVREYDNSYSVQATDPELLRDVGLSAEQVAALQKGMEMVTEQGGTAYSVFRDCDIDVAGKTGSVQTGDRPNNGVFVCYAPADEPRIAVALVVEKGGGGSRVAFIARNIVEAYFALEENRSAVPTENSLQN